MNITDDQLASIQRWLDAQHLVAAVYLFGSRVKGTARPDSDLDLAVELEYGPEPFQTFMIHAEDWQTELRELTGLEVNVDWYHEFEAPKAFAYVHHGHLRLQRKA